MDLRVGNGAKVVALTVETYYFTLSNGFILELDTFYFVLVLSRNIISISYVALNRFKFIIERKYYSFYNNRVFFLWIWWLYKWLVYTWFWNAYVQNKLQEE